MPKATDFVWSTSQCSAISVHLVLEADSKQRLSAGMHKLMISIARRLNVLWGRGQKWIGKIFERALSREISFGDAHKVCETRSSRRLRQWSKARCQRLPRSFQLVRRLRRLLIRAKIRVAAGSRSLEARQASQLVSEKRLAPPRPHRSTRTFEFRMKPRKPAQKCGEATGAKAHQPERSAEKSRARTAMGIRSAVNVPPK